MTQQNKCELCGAETDRTIELEYGDGQQRVHPCCEKCAGAEGDSQALAKVAVRFMLKHGAMPGE